MPAGAAHLPRASLLPFKPQQPEQAGNLHLPAEAAAQPCTASQEQGAGAGAWPQAPLLRAEPSPFQGMYLGEEVAAMQGPGNHAASKAERDAGGDPTAGVSAAALPQDNDRAETEHADMVSLQQEAQTRAPDGQAAQNDEARYALPSLPCKSHPCQSARCVQSGLDLRHFRCEHKSRQAHCTGCMLQSATPRSPK
jgi:hypothetical protein